MTQSPPPATEPQSAPEAPERPAFEGFGTFQGVYIPSILTILGVILYLRLGWVVGEAGLWPALGIITLATLITLITGLSISAVATNMKVRGGGAYYIVSRSFGVESGAAIGLPLFLAQATGVSFYMAGFAESVHTLLPAYSVREIALVTLLVLTVLAFISTALALKTQLLIFAVIVISLASFFLGSPLPADTPLPSLGEPSGFWIVFAVFFPAVTGILAGVSMSGVLKDPGRSLPLGTLGAVGTGYLVYVAIAVMLWAYVPVPVLRSDPQVMWKVAWFPEAIYAGIWGATLSSAMGALLGAARTLQALAQDRVVFRALGRTYGKTSDPRLATVVVFLIAALGISVGSLNAIAPVLSMFYLTSYGTLNQISAVEGALGNPSWRPSFRVRWQVSQIGAVLCMATMVMINLGASLLALAACLTVYFLMQRRRMRTHWSDIRGAILRALARFSIYRLSRYQEMARTWRPNILLLCGAPRSRWHLVELADALTHGKGFLTLAVALDRENLSEEQIQDMQVSLQDYLMRRETPALVRIKHTRDFFGALKGLIDDYGLGSITPNTVMMGLPIEPSRIESFARLIAATCETRRNVLVVKVSERGPDAGMQVPTVGTLRIHIWIEGQDNNANLMLVFAYLLHASPEWAGAELTIKALIPNEEARAGIEENLAEFLRQARLEAEISTEVKGEEPTRVEEIARASRSADLVFLGLRQPEEDEDAAIYARYLQDMLQGAQVLNNAVLTLAGQEIEFREVFQ